MTIIVWTGLALCILLSFADLAQIRSRRQSRSIKEHPWERMTICVVRKSHTGVNAAKLAMTLVISTAVIIGFGNLVWAQEFDTGKFEYQSSCAPCHGTDGKGGGPVSPLLKVPPSDLTVLAKKNNGVFPFNAAYQLIDGRQAVIAHGTRDMPIWGNRYTLSQIHQSVQGYPGSSYDPEYLVRMRILAVIDYLNRMQEK